MAPLSTSVSREIAAPPERVFALAANFAEAHRTISTIVRVEMLTPGPVGVGTRFRETRKMFGKEASETMEVTTFEAPSRYVLVAVSSGTRYRSELSFIPKNGGTELTMAFEAEPMTLLAKIFSFVLGRPMMKAVVNACTKDLEDLKRALESPGEASAG